MVGSLVGVVGFMVKGCLVDVEGSSGEISLYGKNGVSFWSFLVVCCVIYLRISY